MLLHSSLLGLNLPNGKPDKGSTSSANSQNQLSVNSRSMQRFTSRPLLGASFLARR
jgi:hypothetical protein